MIQKTKRVTWVISHNRADGQWYASLKGEANIAYRTQHLAIQTTALNCRYALRSGTLSEMKIKGRDGRIRDSRTYGKDPRHSRG